MKTENKRNDNVLALRWAQPRKIHSTYNPPKHPGLDFSEAPSRTDQSQARECDVNQILARYQKTGVLPGVNKQAVFADVSDSITYQDALNTVLNAQTQFDSLDAHTRKKFANDPSLFLDFVHDPKNLPELVKMGLATEPLPSDTDRLINEIRKSKPSSDADPAPAAGSRSSKSQKDNA